VRQITVDVNTSGGIEDGDRFELARRLRAELLELDVDDADFVRAGAAPSGSKADAMMLSTLILSFAASGGVFTSIIGAVRDWLLRQTEPGVVVDMTIDGDSVRIEGASTEERQRLLEAFVARHAVEPG
jgi:Flp pilus assembly CpaE family ATPase